MFIREPVLPEGEGPLAGEQRDTTAVPSGVSLGDLSPDLRKLEQYYTASINLELASLDISEENRELADDYISRLGDLNTEYKQLNEELNEIGPNEQTITAMIQNLQYRLQLLLKLKEKLNELKSSKNETVQSGSV
jgi:flagellar motility protein MotE (MotC chaperone)